jgi:hypothetical protein
MNWVSRKRLQDQQCPAQQPGLPGTLDRLVGSFADLGANFNAYQAAFQAAVNEDRARIEDRRSVSAARTERLRKLAGYLEVVAGGDAAKLMGTGYDLRKDIRARYQH